MVRRSVGQRGSPRGGNGVRREAAAELQGSIEIGCQRSLTPPLRQRRVRGVPEALGPISNPPATTSNLPKQRRSPGCLAYPWSRKASWKLNVRIHAPRDQRSPSLWRPGTRRIRASRATPIHRHVGRDMVECRRWERLESRCRYDVGLEVIRGHRAWIGRTAGQPPSSSKFFNRGVSGNQEAVHSTPGARDPPRGQERGRQDDSARCSANPCVPRPSL